ncbi:HlyC/CorC family transporter [Candidatus Aerophobetes bacterium]|nr:HlyC/CorC family transporter [Candidatus Aerophobetes bacterium]
MLDAWIILIILIVCVGLSAFFSGSEIALSSLGKITLKRLGKENPHKKHYFDALISNPSQWLTTILIGNNLVNITAASLATVLTEKWIGGAQGKVVGIATGITTFVILLFGEITPKRYCREYAEKVSLKVIGPIIFLSEVLLPAVKALNFLTQGILGPVARKALPKLITEKEIHTLIDIGQEEGALEEKEEELVHSALEFDETIAKEIMTPRTKIVAISREASLTQLAKLINEAGYSRIPVYDGRLDNIVGTVYAKDLLPIADKWDTLKVKDIIHPPIFVPYAMKLSEIFHQLQREKTHLAVVVDEYGGVAGIITVEDLLEELVGEIEDEYDTETSERVQLLKDGSALVEGDTDIDEINDKLETSLPEKAESFESISGFICNHMGKIPRKGEVIEQNGVRIEVVDVDAKRIKKVKISRMPQTEEKKPSS